MFSIGRQYIPKPWLKKHTSEPLLRLPYLSFFMSNIDHVALISYIYEYLHGGNFVE